MTLWIENLQRLITLVEEKIAEHRQATGELDLANYGAWRARVDAADNALIKHFTDEEGARFSKRPPHDHTVQMAGIRSSSTGTAGAISLKAVGSWCRIAASVAILVVLSKARRPVTIS